MKRAATIFRAIVVLAVSLAALPQFFGGMERPAPEYRAAYEQLVSQGAQTSMQSRFTIPVLGCRCHSTDPVQQVQHSVYRLRECRECH